MNQDQSLIKFMIQRKKFSDKNNILDKYK